MLLKKAVLSQNILDPNFLCSPLQRAIEKSLSEFHLTKYTMKERKLLINNVLLDTPLRLIKNYRQIDSGSTKRGPVDHKSVKHNVNLLAERPVTMKV